ncbi:MAG: DUF1015 domain-containing protein [Clostridia bacterium]|nr:DUF1015 domain-containing protein [Clostridia bacterium]
MDSLHTIKRTNILYPKKGTDMTAFSVIACDQFTSDALYWEEVEKAACGKVSSLNLILPEIYLSDAEKRIPVINEKMRQYVEGDVFDETDDFILVERTTKSGTRRGVLLAVDLEDFSFAGGTRAPIRSTEETILERVPPRAAIRKEAPLELPHVMLLYDDREGSVLSSVRKGETIYDFDLMMGGGHVRGTKISNSDEVMRTFYALDSTEKEGFLFAVGDGNHSLAAAKAHWDNVKKDLSAEDRKDHPARYALAEAVNIYDEALRFEPIHRFVRCKNPRKLQSMLRFSGDEKFRTVIDGMVSEMPFFDDIPAGIREVDAVIREFLLSCGGDVDYIHGDENVIELSSDGIGIMLPGIKKENFFRMIESGGNLPRKTFSMGEGIEKRYYVEARKIR